MKIPFVIDNIHVTLAGVLNHLLGQRPGQQLDIATAYFSIRGYQQLRQTLPAVAGMRLLLGDSPAEGVDIGLRPDSAAYLRGELNAEPLSEETQRLVEELVRFLRRHDVQVRLYLGHEPGEAGRRKFLHAKCYLVYGGKGEQLALAGLLNPLVGIVGSSNFTAPGLTTNRELNLVHKTLLEPDEVDDPVAGAIIAHHADQQANPNIAPENKRLLKSEVGVRAIDDLVRWYDEQWQLAVDFKEDLIELLENSKFGGREYTPYEIYMKALFEYFRDDLDADFNQVAVRSAVELSEFQEDAVKKARRILARYDGIIVADSVGLGKTWIGKKLLEDYAYHMRQKALVICPASLRSMWAEELRSATIAATVLSQEQLGQEGFEIRPFADVDVILIDEAHNFRNRLANRYRTLETLIAANGRRGRDGSRKKLILLTATPINNNIFDLYNQINLFAGNDRTYFAAAGIGDLYRYFLAARRDSIEQGSIRIFNLLEEVVIRRTRQFIRRAYPEATIGGRRITWPERRLRTVRYDLESTYEGIYQQIVRRIEALHLPHYNLESYRLDQENLDEFELGRQQALVGIFKSRFLKRLESSIDAFRISIRRALEFAKTFDEYVQDGIVLDSASFQAAMRLVAADEADSEDNGMPHSRAEAIDEHAAAREIIDALPRLDPSKYDRRRLHRDLTRDIESLTDIWYQIRDIGYADDAKLQRFKELLLRELRGQKVLVFSYYKDTARYLYQALMQEENAGWRKAMGDPLMRRIDSGTGPADRVRVVERFAPRAQGREEILGTDQEIDILISTDVLSEGQNLQDCGYLINYDLHWNPTRMVQRAGRIDRLGSEFDVLTIYNMFPEEALEDLLGLVRRLTAKIDTINQTGFLDASVLGEVVTPRDFNTLRRIAGEDNTVIDEQESFLELASSEAMLAELQRVLATEAQEWVTDLDDGIHSGLQRDYARGVFFYFKAPHPDGGSSHFWRYYDLRRREIIDNRYQIMQIIACGPETPRFPPPYDEIDIYDLQEKVMADILGHIEQQTSAAIVGSPVAEEQNIARQVLQQHLSNPALDRAELQKLRKFLKQPLVGASVATLRQALKVYSASSDPQPLVQAIGELYQQQGRIDMAAAETPRVSRIAREDLHLVCYEYICT
ncbi:MAG: helicase-related protein [Anaerolineae bacterium]